MMTKEQAEEMLVLLREIRWNTSFIFVATSLVSVAIVVSK